MLLFLAAGSTFWCSSLTACPSPINFTYFTGRQPLNIPNERTFAHIKIKFPHKLPAQHFWWHFFPSPRPFSTIHHPFPSSISKFFLLLMCKHNWGFYSTQVRVPVCVCVWVCLSVYIYDDRKFSNNCLACDVLISRRIIDVFVMCVCMCVCVCVVSM